MLLSFHLHPSRFSSSPRTTATFLMSAMHTTPTPTPNPSTAADQHLNQALLYHEQTKHQLTRYARGPHGLDWANQPNPFLRYTSSPLLPLFHFPSPSSSPPYYSLFDSIPIPPQPLTYSTLSSLLYDSLSLSAWKSTGFSTWSLRVNPSSGNLHPTECYIVSPKLPKEESSDFGGNGSLYFDSTFVAHYSPKEHALELRSVVSGKGFGELGFPKHGSFVVGLSSVFWREAWKYGERAFRYCNHDVGHAIAAVVIAAASLGWDVRILDGLGQEDLRSLFGIGFGFEVAKPDFLPSRPVKGRMPWLEMEHPDCALLVFPARGGGQERLEEVLDVDYVKLRSEIAKLKSLEWFGKPNSLSKDHICWDIIYKTAEAVEKPSTSHEQFKINPFHSNGLISEGLYKDSSVREVVRKRRSAVDMDGVHVMSRETFYQILLHCLPSGELGSGEKQGKQFALPFRVLPWDSEVHAALFVHRVKDLPRGLYFLVRNEDHFDSLKRAMRSEFEWEKPEGCPVGLPLYRLTKGDCRDVAKTLSCHQDIAADGCFSLGMIARFEPTLRESNAWMYPRLFWETGILGQVLYLEAHAVGISATGIGCYFDDAVHEVLGLKGKEFQSLYHFTVGGPVVDRRIMSLPAYPGPQVDA